MAFERLLKGHGAAFELSAGGAQHCAALVFAWG